MPVKDDPVLGENIYHSEIHKSENNPSLTKSQSRYLANQAVLEVKVTDEDK